MGSGLRMVWPPAIVPPACITTSEAAEKIAAMTSCGRFSGNAAMFTARMTRPPIAKTSLHALAAAIAPKSNGLSTSGGKKSVVLTSATSSVI